MSTFSAALGLAVCLCFGAFPSPQAQSRDFTADLVVLSAGAPASPLTGKLFVLGGKVRIEDPQLPQGVFLVDADTGSALFYREGRRLLMDAKETSVLTQLLVPVAPERPCAAWQHMAEIAGATQQSGAWRCGAPEGQGGMPAYEAFSPRDARYKILIDPRLGFPVRIESPGGIVLTLDNLRDDTPAASVFELPAGLRKFDPQPLIDRIKQSDVWVEPPK